MLVLIKNSIYHCFQIPRRGVRIEAEFPSTEKTLLEDKNFNVCDPISATDDTSGLGLNCPL